MAVVTVSIRTRMTMAVLRVKDGVIVMQTMLWPDEIRAADFANLDEDAHATAKELEMANMLIESLAGDYEPGEYEDDYAQAVEALVKAKVEGGEVRMAPSPRTSPARSWTSAALAKSVEKAKASRGEALAAETKPAKKAAEKRAPAKKAAAKKTAAKKTAKKAS